MLKDLFMHKLSQVSVYLAILIALFSARPWFIWGNSYVEIIVLFFFIISRVSLMKNKISRRDSSITIFCIILSIYIYIVNASDISTAFSLTCTKIIPLCLFIQLKNKEKELFIDGFTTLFSVILLISLFSFTLFQLGFSLPYAKISHSDAHYSEFYNYYTFIIDGHLGIFTRFRSVFTEPGHVGMFAAIVMYVNNYRMSVWKFVVLMVTIIWSFSLAAYILTALGFVLYMQFNCRTKYYLFLIPFVLFIAYVSVSVYYKENRNSLISELIISRLEITKDGNISGNNRHTQEFTTYYNQFKETPKYITGLSAYEFGELPFLSGNASYKNYILQHGLIGIVLRALFGISCCNSYRSLQYLGLFVLYFAAFLQRPYALWEVESFLYVAYSCNAIRVRCAA